MIYERYFLKAEQNRWQLETDIPWDAIDLEAAAAQPLIIENLREAALIESYAPMYALKGLSVWWNSIEESAIASIQFYEEYKHYFALKRYLEHVGVSVDEREIIEVRERSFDSVYTDRVRQLANYMISEHFTAYFYQRLLDEAREPVMRTLLELLVKDELRHCSVFYSLLEKRIADDPKEIDIVLQEALDFRHQATEVVGERLPIAQKNDFQALLHFWNRIERLTGVDLREVKKKSLETSERET